MRLRLVAAASVGWTLAAVATGVAASAARHPGDTPRAIFGNQMLLPNESVHSDITVSGASVAVRPYLQISDVRQGCAAVECTAPAPALAGLLRLSVLDNHGDAWTGTFASAERRVALPGGVMAAHQSRTYQITMTMSAAADNRYEGLTISGHFAWGGTVATGAAAGHGSGTVGTGVLGERIGRGSGSGSSASVQGDSLPFTGFDVIAALAVAGALIGLGGTLVGAARRRRTAHGPSVGL